MVIEKPQHSAWERKTHQVCRYGYLPTFSKLPPHTLILMFVILPWKPKVVLLDHGMYRRLDSKLRVDNCKLWKAFMTRDTELGTKTAVDLGLPPERCAPGLDILLSSLLCYARCSPNLTPT